MWWWGHLQWVHLSGTIFHTFLLFLQYRYSSSFIRLSEIMFLCSFSNKTQNKICVILGHDINLSSLTRRRKLLCNIQNGNCLEAGGSVPSAVDLGHPSSLPTSQVSWLTWICICALCLSSWVRFMKEKSTAAPSPPPQDAWQWGKPSGSS